MAGFLTYFRLTPSLNKSGMCVNKIAIKLQLKLTAAGTVTDLHSIPF